MIINEMNFSNMKWIDHTAPTKEKLTETATALGVPEAMLLNCLDPDFLPHLDSYNDVFFLMLRACEPNAFGHADSIQELTTKIAVFIKNDMILSFHRLPLEEINVTTQKISKVQTETGLQYFIQTLTDEIALGYDKPLMELENQTDDFEEKILNKRNSRNLLRDGFVIKRKASAYKKVIKFTSEVINKLVNTLNFDEKKFGFIKEKFDRYQFYSDDVFENIQGLLNLHIAIQSQKTNEASFRTNEIVRVLTVLTIFFLPLNFIAGVYGMNFEHMPLIKHPDGFWISLGFMAVICVGLFIYVVKKGWIAPPPKE